MYMHTASVYMHINEKTPKVAVQNTGRIMKED